MPRRILVHIASADLGRIALDEALRHAALASPQQRPQLVLFHTESTGYAAPIGDMTFLGNVPPEPIDASAAALDHVAREMLQRAIERAEACGVAAIAEMGHGADDVGDLLDAVRRHGCEMVIVATHPENAVVRLLSGNVTTGLITASPVPVLVVKPPVAMSG